jgi:hypothetical protein
MALEVKPRTSPGVPPLEGRFVIVDNGREVRRVVVAPLTTIATANLLKK